MTVDKIVKFIVKNETTRYSPSEDSTTVNKKTSEEKKLKRLSFPIIPATLARIKPKLKLSKSLQDVSEGNNVKEAISQGVVVAKDLDESDSVPNTPDTLEEVDEEEESHYAVADVFKTEEEEKEANDSEDENEESKEPAEESKKKRRDSAAKKALKRMSFPLPGAFAKMNNKLKNKTKSLENVCAVEIENPYYAQSDIKRSSLEEISEGNDGEGDEALILCYNHGCDTQVKKSNLQRHQAECKHVVEKCPNEGCNLKLKRIDVNKHDIVECEYAVLKCKNSSCHATVLRKMMPQHLEACEKGVKSVTGENFAAYNSTSKDTYEAMTPSVKEEIIYASSNLLTCPAPRCLYQGAGSSLTQHICAQHSELLLKYLSELKNIFSKDDSNTSSKDLSHLYTKPCKKVAPTPRPRKTSDKDCPIYSTPSKNNMETEKQYLEVEAPLYTTPDERISVSLTEATEYLTPIDGKADTDEHLYLTPLENVGNKSAKGCFLDENQGEYGYASVLCKSY